MWADGRKSWQAVPLIIAAQAGVAVVSAQEVADTGVTIAERLERIESALSNQGLLEMVQQIQSLEVEINRLSGEMEVQNHVLEQLKKRQRDLYTDIDRRLQRLENPLTAATGELAGEGEPPLQTLSPFEGTEVTAGQQAETPLTLELVDQVGQAPAPGRAGEDVIPLTVPPDQAAEQVPEPAPPASSPALEAALSEIPEEIAAATPGQESAASGTSGEVAAEAPAAVDPVLIEAAYRHAFNLLKQSLYDRAIRAFREFLVRYPGTEYAGNAQFWLAEAYYVNSRFGQALVEYSTLVQRYPESPKLAQATLKAAFCQHELGQVEAARRQLDEIIQQYPGTTAASLAQDRLADIAAETAAVTTIPAN